jgi:hypothetical protein
MCTSDVECTTFEEHVQGLARMSAPWNPLWPSGRFQTNAHYRQTNQMTAEISKKVSRNGREMARSDVRRIINLKTKPQVFSSPPAPYPMHGVRSTSSNSKLRRKEENSRLHRKRIVDASKQLLAWLDKNTPFALEESNGAEVLLLVPVDFMTNTVDDLTAFNGRVFLWIENPTRSSIDNHKTEAYSNMTDVFLAGRHRNRRFGLCCCDD